MTCKEEIHRSVANGLVEFQRAAKLSRQYGYHQNFQDWVDGVVDQASDHEHAILQEIKHEAKVRAARGK